jgi:hypothetical protein
MRKILLLLILLPLIIPVVGCGGGKPDPRQREDFVDTSDPSTVINTMGDPADRPK